MTLTSITGGKIAKPASEKSFTQSAVGNTQLKKIAAILKACWPVKTVATVAYLTGTSERCVKFWLAGQTRMSLESVVALLRTEAGFEILEAVLGDCKEEWWLVTKSAQNIRQSRKAIKKEQARIDGIRAQLDLLDQ